MAATEQTRMGNWARAGEMAAGAGDENKETGLNPRDGVLGR